MPARLANRDDLVALFLRGILGVSLSIALSTDVEMNHLVVVLQFTAIPWLYYLDGSVIG
jgi:hypothetical protein